jgi:hypothetical protein
MQEEVGKQSSKCTNVEDGDVLHFVVSFFWERNDRSFKNSESTVAELTSFVFKTLYHCTAALDFNMFSFHNFLNLFSLSNYVFFPAWYLSCTFNDIFVYFFFTKKKKWRNVDKIKLSLAWQTLMGSGTFLQSTKKTQAEDYCLKRPANSTKTD